MLEIMVGASKVVIVFQAACLPWILRDAIRRKDLDAAKLVLICTIPATGFLIERVRALHSPWPLLCLIAQVIVSAGMVPLWRALRGEPQRNPKA